MSVHNFRAEDASSQSTKKFPASSFTSSIKQKPRSGFGASFLRVFSCCSSRDDYDDDANEKARPVLTIGSPTNFRHEKVCIPGLENYNSNRASSGALKLSSPERNWTTLHNLAAEKEVSLSPSSTSSSLPSPLTPKEEQQPQLSYHVIAGRDSPTSPSREQTTAKPAAYDQFWSTENMVNSRPETVASSPAKSEQFLTSPAKSLAASSMYSPYASPERGILGMSPTGLRQHPVGMIDYQLRELPATPDQRR